MGGMAKAIETGLPKMRIEEAAARTQARIDSGVQTIVGVNKYRLAKEAPIDILEIDNTAVREEQVARLQDLRGKRDEAAVQKALADITECVKTKQGNLLDLVVKATGLRASLGEISGLSWETAPGPVSVGPSRSCPSSGHRPRTSATRSTSSSNGPPARRLVC